jgi:hypothetical protein
MLATKLDQYSYILKFIENKLFTINEPIVSMMICKDDKYNAQATTIS